MRANQFRSQVSTILAYLDDPSDLHLEKTWYRLGTRGNLHIDANCHKLDRWNKKSSSLTLAEASKKKTCPSCSPRFLTNKTFNTLTTVANSVAALEDILTNGSKHLKTGTMLGIGTAIHCYDDYGSILADISKDDAKLVSKALRRLELVRASFTVLLQEATTAAVGDAPSWAAAAIARRIVSDLETNIPDADDGDIRLYGENTDETKDNLYMLSRLYLRWHRKRTQGLEPATNAALDLLKQASFKSIAQLEFVVNPPKDSMLLGVWAKEVWQTETQNRLLNRLIPAWEKRYTALVAKTDTKLIGIGCEALRSKAGRALVHTYPVRRHNGFVVALVPEVIAQYLQVAEKKWYSDVVEITDACSTDVLDAVATLWEPYSPQSTFQRLSDAAIAADKL